MSSSLLSPPSLITLPPSLITLPPSQMTPPSQTQFAAAPGAPTKKINHGTISEQYIPRILF